MYPDSNRSRLASSRILLMLLSAAALGLAIHVRDGLYSPAALLLLAAAVVTCIAAALAHGPILTERTTRLMLLAIVSMQLVAMFFKPAGATPPTVPLTDPWPLYVAIGFALAACLVICFATEQAAVWGFMLLLATHAAAGVWKILSAPQPRIDVFMFQVNSIEAMASGENPYAISFPNIYAPKTSDYSPQTLHEGRLRFGYPYPPVVLMFTAPVHLLAGDFRFAQLAAMLAAATMITAIRPDRIGMLVAGVLLFTPRTFYVLEMGWTEPLSVMLLAATTLCHARCPRLIPLAMGLLIASKQYLPAALFLLPLATSRNPQPVRRWLGDRKTWLQVILIVLVAAGVTLPLALRNPTAFWRSVIALQFLQPYRPDSLSFLAWWGSDKPGWTGPIWPAFVAMALAIGLSLRRACSFPAAMALCFLTFFCLNKQAFANYYYLALGAMCCAAAWENCTPATACADKSIIGQCARPLRSSCAP